jgi:hypothetical protein
VDLRLAERGEWLGDSKRSINRVAAARIAGRLFPLLCLGSFQLKFTSERLERLVLLRLLDVGDLIPFTLTVEVAHRSWMECFRCGWVVEERS